MIAFIMVVALLVALFVSWVAWRAEPASLEEGVLVAVAGLAWFVFFGALGQFWQPW